ncbi:hypothetical protein C8R46DRAFT_1212609 [Mycena filopes]|nr:hypothetical protein C8R46DRAFT_1212609 [Mycena filopes]
MFPPPDPTEHITQSAVGYLPAMSWGMLFATRSQIAIESGDEDLKAKTIQAILIPDGLIMSKWCWIRVPRLAGVGQPRHVDDLNVDLWIDCLRGSGEATSDLTGRSFQIDRYPLDEPENLEHSYTVVVAPQHTVGPHVHPLNHLINGLVPGLEEPWRGNVLVFRHAKTPSQAVIPMEWKDWNAVEMILKTVFREKIVTGVPF